MLKVSKEPRRPGRPRQSRLDEALLDAGLAVILERGYHGASLAEIARRAGAGTPAIYRRWPTKAELAMDLVVRVNLPEPIPDTGSIRNDLVEFMRLRLETWATPVFRQLLLPLVLEGFAEGSVAAAVGERFIQYRRALDARIRRAVSAGELRADTNPTRLLDLLMGTVTMPLLFFQDIPPVDQAESIVDQVLSGFAIPARVTDHET
jgi:AcrR family transcriptional regulator